MRESNMIEEESQKEPEKLQQDGTKNLLQWY